MGVQPDVFWGEREKADVFITDFQAYFLLNEDVPSLTPFKKIMIVITAMKGDKVKEWVKSMTQWRCHRR